MNFHSMTYREAEEYIHSRKYAHREKNILATAKKKSIVKRFFMQFSDFTVIVLLIAAGLSAAISFIGGEGDFIDPLIMLSIVVVNAILGVIEESKADNAIEALKKISSPSATIRRNGKIITIPAENVQVGDILILQPGCCIGADARLIKSADLETDESALTGEAMPAPKNHDCVLDKFTPVAERKNMVFASGGVLRGTGEAIVTGVGTDTEMGKIAALMQSEEDEPTPLQKKLAETGRYLATGALIICGTVFLLGIIRRFPPFTMFLTSVSLAVAAIPEGLPATVTVVLAIGVRRMTRKNAIVKRLSAVETLGGATVICSDKTGTLTQNRMAVADTYADDKTALFELAVLCCRESANPTEQAILKEAERMGIRKNEHFETLSERPFSSERKMMSVEVEYYGKNRIVTKGAAEIVLRRCTHYTENGQLRALTSVQMQKILGKIRGMSENALRVIAVAYKDTPHTHITENDLVFLGLIGMNDPPRPEAKHAVTECIAAGIRPVMITGDSKTTAVAIAEQVGIKGNAITGPELAHISDAELTEYGVFSRVTPADKVRIVKAFRNSGNIVAMTGDGVNDAPALKAADIGCSMGKKGTDVAKEASDLILADDNFATIVSAVREGRAIFDNIKKSVQFLLSSNIGEIITVFFAMLFGLEPPLKAIQLLWVNLVTDSLPALALGLDPAAPNIMRRKPRNPEKGLFADGLWLSICLEGAMIGALALLAYTVGFYFFDFGKTPDIARTMAFCVLSLSQLFHAFNMRSENSVLNRSFFGNPFLLLSLAAGTLLQISTVNTAAATKLFKTTPLPASAWIITAALSLMPIFIIELQKAFSRHF